MCIFLSSITMNLVPFYYFFGIMGLEPSTILNCVHWLRSIDTMKFTQGLRQAKIPRTQILVMCVPWSEWVLSRDIWHFYIPPQRAIQVRVIYLLKAQILSLPLGGTRSCICDYGSIVLVTRRWTYLPSSYMNFMIFPGLISRCTMSWSRKCFIPAAI